LALLSIFFGYIASDLFVGIGSDMLSTALFVHPIHVVIIEGEFALPLLIKNLPAILSVFGAGLAILLYHQYPAVLVYFTYTRLGLAIYRFFNAKWAFDIIYNKYILSPALFLGLITSKILDRGVIELLGPYGLSVSLYGSSIRLASADTGSVSTYGLSLITIILSIISILFGPMIMLDFPLDFSLILVLISAIFYMSATQPAI
jgi:NADH-ubiquinone oxidoreductase chain 5